VLIVAESVGGRERGGSADLVPRDAALRDVLQEAAVAEAHEAPALQAVAGEEAREHQVEDVLLGAARAAGGGHEGHAAEAASRRSWPGLTRRLVDVSQDVIISDHDCGTAPAPS